MTLPALSTHTAMTRPTFDDLTPPSDLMAKWIEQSRTPDCIGRYCEDAALTAAARWGAEQAAERLANQWPTPITDRPPTEADGDDLGRVQYVCNGNWSQCKVGLWDEEDEGWQHTPRWQRPAPLTLKEQALKNVDFIADNATGGDLVSRLNQIRRALEADS